MLDLKGNSEKQKGYGEWKELVFSMLFLLVCFSYCMLLLLIISFAFHSFFSIHFNQILTVSLMISIIMTFSRMNQKKKVRR